MRTDEAEKIELPDVRVEPRERSKQKAKSQGWWLLFFLGYMALISLPDLFTFLVGFTFRQSVVTVAGAGGPASYQNLDRKDRIKASQAYLNFTTGVALDPLGNVYLAELGNNRILKVNSKGDISVFAGTGKGGYSGDGGPAVKAEISHPYFLVTDGRGNLYFSDAHNHRIRKVDAKGVITTFAGIGKPGYDGEALEATASAIHTPGDMAFDKDGNFYFADIENQRIRKIDTQGIMTTVAGTGTAGFSGDGGPARSATLNYPESVQLDGAGNLYLSDTANGRVRKIDKSGIITTVAGDTDPGFMGFLRTAFRSKKKGPARFADLSQPYDLVFDVKGNLFVSDRDRNRIIEIMPDGQYHPVLKRIKKPYLDFWNHFDDEHANRDVAQFLNEPKALALDRTGNLFIADAGNNQVRMLPHAAAPGLYNGAPYPP